MQNKSRTVVALVLLAALFLSFVLPIAAESNSAEQPNVSEAEAVYFYHLESQRPMIQKKAQTVLPAGSTVKILSGLIACEQLAARLQDVVTVTEDMVKGSVGYRYPPLRAGSVYTVQDLLYLALCGSYNNAYDVLAYLIGGGNTSLFVEMMNQKARALGALSTTAGDPTGIADNSLTTAEDLFRIAAFAIENSLYMRVSGSGTYDLSDGNRISNRNELLFKTEGRTRYYNPLCQGLSAGSTPKGGASLVTMAQKNNDRYLCVVLGAQEVEVSENDTETYSYVIANRLIEWGYEHYRYLEILTPKTEICRLPVTVSDLTEAVPIVPERAFSAYLPANAELGKDIALSIRLMYEALEAPVKSGVHVGYVAVIYQGEILGSVALYTAGEAERSSFVSSLLQIRSLTQKRGVAAGLICFAVTTVAWIVTETVLRRRRRHKWDKYYSEKIDLPETILKKRK